MPALCLKAVSKLFSWLIILPRYLICVVVWTTSPFLKRTLGGNLAYTDMHGQSMKANFKRLAATMSQLDDMKEQLGVTKRWRKEKAANEMHFAKGGAPGSEPHPHLEKPEELAALQTAAIVEARKTMAAITGSACSSDGEVMPMTNRMALTDE